MANFLTKIYNLWRQPTRRHNLTYDKYLPYFADDNFPLKWHDVISKSPSATSCVSTIRDFLEGSGFSDPELEKLVVNSKGETLFQIHQKTVNDFGEYEGFYWRFMYNGLGQRTDWEVLPFESCRLGRPDDNGFISQILYNPYFGTADFKISRDTIYYDAFNPLGIKTQILNDGANYKGQVFYWGTTTAMSRFYPMPEATSSMKWMQAEAGVSDYHEDNINNGFLQPFMLAMIGDPNEPIGTGDSEKTITRGEELDRVISENFMGAKRVGNMWVSWFANKEEIPIVVSMPSNNTSEQFLTMDNQATKKITIAFKVPAILANINEGVSLGGDGNTIRVAVKLMQQRVIKKQRVLTDAYQMALKLGASPYTQDITIAPYNPYPELEVVDQKIWDAMTVPERRKWITENTEIVLLEDELIEETPQLPQPQQARLLNALPVPFPEKIRNSVKRTLDYLDKMELKCGGKGGREVAEAIVANQSMGLRNLKRIHSYLKKRQEMNGLPNDNCDVILYNSWGGKDMELFLESKLKELDAWLN